MNYDFSTLNDKDFEELARDLLSKKLQMYFQSFKIGKDKGIDLRYSTTENENKIIVQVKHYRGSKFSNLISVLKNEELEKISKLNPERYIIVTSLPLNPIEKEKIKDILSPYIVSTSDIYGKENINSLISEFPEIEEKYYKLWLSSTIVLNRVLKNGIKGRSEFAESEIVEKIRIFVANKEYDKAVNILNLKHFILITGAPGIGKTILANMLTYQLLAKDFELVYVTDIKEADDAYGQEKKQLFYFDDFLGSTTLDLKSSRNVDTLIVNFIERVKKDKQKRLILTCRTTLLNQAKENSEKLDNSKIDIAKYEVKIEDYSKLEKAKILYNHIYFSNLTDDLKKTFFKNEFYWKVIKHRNYNPRIIEFFTDTDRIEHEISYEKLIINFLDYPEKIWKHSFERQISEASRIFLSTMFSLSGRYIISEERLKEVFDNRINYEIRNNNFTKANNLFNSTIKELQNAFIKHTLRIYDHNYKTSEFFIL
ncbi:MAG: restriction endonuclease [Bacteroidales bacterium]|nr:restriction endonuclease [Bacteroidales bacterium]